MADQGKDADLGARDPYAETAVELSVQAPPNSLADAGKTGAAREARPASRVGLSDHTRTRLAAQLRAMYDTVAQQPVPDRFADLIAKLDSGDREKV